MLDEELSKGSHLDGCDEQIKFNQKTGVETVVADTGEVLATIDPVAEKKLLWKFDLKVLPVLAVMYLFNSLDKRFGVSILWLSKILN